MKFLTGLFLLCATFSFSQTDFDNYKPLSSKGSVPADFSQRTSEKILEDSKTDIPDLSRRQKEQFIEQVNYTIDGLLKSGSVTYGDEVSTYLQKIGDKLCATDDELRGKLRFYTLNANEANAFSTNQGMVFVTTGLIAQMTSEAQLAYVLAHEIIHYREKHVLDLYGYVTDNRTLSYGEKVRFFSKYSRDNEFEADTEGLKLYYATGYASEEILITFDVLIYSSLPFEEIPFDKKYFDTPYLKVPPSLFPEKNKKIDVRENYNDRLASHPNIAKRKLTLQKQIDSLANWGQVLEETPGKFPDIRNICRFEYLLNCIYSNKNVEALYSIFLLEKDIPDSRFLRHCKSQIWLELMKQEEKDESLSLISNLNFTTPKRTAATPGEIYALEYFIGRLSPEAKVTLGLRIIHDDAKRNPADALQQKMYDKSLEVAAFNEYFDISRFSTLTLDKAIDKLEKEQKASADSSGNLQTGWNKYETIRNSQNGLSLTAGMDSTKFYLYGISDLVKDSSFVASYRSYKKKFDQREEENDAFFALTDEEQTERKSEKFENEIRLNADTILMVNPLVVHYRSYQRIDYRKSEKLENRVVNSVLETSSDLGITVKQLDRTEQNSMTTQEYNDLAAMMRSLEKSVTETKPDVFLLDQEILDGIRDRYNTSKVILFNLQHEYNSGINLGTGVLFTILFPVGLVYFPAAILTGHETGLDVYVFDLEQGKLCAERNYYSNDPVSEKMLINSFYPLFSQFKKAPENEKN